MSRKPGYVRTNGRGSTHSVRLRADRLHTTISPPVTDGEFARPVPVPRRVRKAHTRTDELTTLTGARGDGGDLVGFWVWRCPFEG